MELIQANGFENITIQKEKPIYNPDDIFQKYLSEEDLDAYRTDNTGIFSITVFASKPLNNSCTPGAGCC